MSRIEELKALEKAATPGKWHYEYSPEGATWYVMACIQWPEGQKARAAICAVNDRCPVTEPQTERNTEIIAAARNALPALLEIAEAVHELEKDATVDGQFGEELMVIVNEPKWARLKAALEKLEAK